MMLKKLLIVSTLLFLLIVVNSMALTEANGHVPHKIIDRFIVKQAENSAILPDNSLLKTSLAGYELLREEGLIKQNSQIISRINSVKENLSN